MIVTPTPTSTVMPTSSVIPVQKVKVDGRLRLTGGAIWSDNLKNETSDEYLMLVDGLEHAVCRKKGENSLTNV
jgi:hypothetical protein